MREQNASISGEDALIAKFRDLIENAGCTQRILNGIGDDAAVWQPSRSNRSIVTADMLIEGVHFTRGLMSLHDAGYRAMAANISDAAASGARPVLATVSLGLPKDTPQDDALALYRGIVACAKEYRCAIAGGDCSASPAIAISIALVGEVRASNVKTRAGAKPGDIAAVTGPLGASRAGLFAAKGDVVLAPEVQAQAFDAFRVPQARVAQGRWLAASAHVRAMMDISDGLSTDLARMCARSSCGALVEDVPVAASALQAARLQGADPQAFALAGGEDFELLVAVAPRAFAHLASRYRARFGSSLIPIGRFREGSGVAARNADGELPLTPSGFDHFNGAAP
ncbi:MAG TPA: thiamine-phosphate kinase [Candidatus Baltobacteraceae bacterium]|nr:thiamine-phosphate kinase [Candidatus Baltobacteraceae bacterium]